MKTTPAMRDRARELASPPADDFERAFRYTLDDLEALERAGKAILAEPYGCAFCDSGKLRNPEKGHNERCGFWLLEAALAAG
jgi:hypothetical protein